MSEEPTSQGVLGRLIGNLKDFIEMKLLYYKLVAYEKSAKMISFLVAAILLIGFFLSSYILINVAVGFMLAEWLDSFFIGFAIIAGLNLSVAILIFVFRKTLILNPLINATVSMIAKNDEHEHEHHQPTDSQS